MEMYRGSRADHDPGGEKRSPPLMSTGVSKATIIDEVDRALLSVDKHWRRRSLEAKRDAMAAQDAKRGTWWDLVEG